MASNLIEIKPVGAVSFTQIKCPSTYKMTSTTLVDSGRNTDGFVVNDVVREGIRKIEISWNFLTLSEFSTIAKLFESGHTGGSAPDKKFACYIKYFDTVIGDFINSELGFTNLNGVDKSTDGNTSPREFYVGDRVTDTAKMVLDANMQPQGYSSVKLSLIEK